MCCAGFLQSEIDIRPWRRRRDRAWDRLVVQFPQEYCQSRYFVNVILIDLAKQRLLLILIRHDLFKAQWAEYIWDPIFVCATINFFTQLFFAQVVTIFRAKL